MRNRRRIAVLIVILVGLILLARWGDDVWYSFLDFVSQVDQEYYEKMQSVQLGMTKEQVIELLGAPQAVIAREEKPEITEYHYPHYLKTIENKNVCLVYDHGIDIKGHYFIDEDDKVYFVNVGGT